jgi:SH3-like domain-containing protein
MSSRSVPRLGLLARLGFGGALASTVLVAVVSLDIRPKAEPASQAANLAGAPLKGTARLADASASGRSRGEGDVTGSLARPALPSASVGPVSGLAMPRFVSLKTDRVNVRQGPTRNQEVTFTFQRVGLPVEITAEFENWRRIRDSEGAEGWVMQGLLSGRRTALVAPWSKELTVPLRSRPGAASAPVALLQPGVLASIKDCAADWCHIAGEGFEGYIEQNRVWGAYPGEAIE